jgi:hypothetical protein
MKWRISDGHFWACVEVACMGGPYGPRTVYNPWDPIRGRLTWCSNVPLTVLTGFLESVKGGTGFLSFLHLTPDSGRRDFDSFLALEYNLPGLHRAM